MKETTGKSSYRDAVCTILFEFRYRTTSYCFILIQTCYVIFSVTCFCVYNGEKEYQQQKKAVKASFIYRVCTVAIKLALSQLFLSKLPPSLGSLLFVIHSNFFIDLIESKSSLSCKIIDCYQSRQYTKLLTIFRLYYRIITGAAARSIISFQLCRPLNSSRVPISFIRRMCQFKRN